MCFYLFSPQKHIHLAYVKESISLINKYSNSSRPLNDVRVDFLLENRSSEPLTEFYVLYPRAFFIAQIRRNGKFKKKLVRHIRDCSDTFLESQHEYNFVLNEGACRTNINPDPVTKKHFLILTENNPTAPLESQDPTRYSGYVIGEGGVKIEPWDHLNDTCIWALSNFTQNFMIFKVTLNHDGRGDPINSGESRWMRWHIPAEGKVLINSSERLRRMKDWILGRMNADYRIFGPHDVLEKFLEQIQAPQEHLSERLRTYAKSRMSAEDTIDGALEELRARINSLHAGSRLTIKDWRIGIIPTDFWSISNIRADKGVIPFGGMPSNYVHNGQALSKFEWLTGERFFTSESKNNIPPKCKFLLVFSIEHPRIPYRLLPWIGILIALTALLHNYR